MCTFCVHAVWAIINSRPVTPGLPSTPETHDKIITMSALTCVPLTSYASDTFRCMCMTRVWIM